MGGKLGVPGPVPVKVLPDVPTRAALGKHSVSGLGDSWASSRAAGAKSASLTTKALSQFTPKYPYLMSQQRPLMNEFQHCLLGTRRGVASYCPISTVTKARLVPLLRVIPRCELAEFES